MKELIISCVSLVFCCCSTSYAQTEVYISKDTARVETLQGIAITSNEVWKLGKSSSLNSLLEASYFYELHLTDNASLFMDAGLSTSFFKGGSVTVPMFNQLGVFIDIAPRYYFSLQQRESAAQGGLNAGWFVALPLRVSTDIIPSSIYKWGGVEYPTPSRPKFGEFITYSAGLNIGYRYAFTNRMFLEGAVGGGYQTINFKIGTFYLNALLKIAYTF